MMLRVCRGLSGLYIADDGMELTFGTSSGAGCILSVTLILVDSWMLFVKLIEVLAVNANVSVRGESVCVMLYSPVPVISVVAVAVIIRVSLNDKDLLRVRGRVSCRLSVIVLVSVSVRGELNVELCDAVNEKEKERDFLLVNET
jgi:hypothetical protein